MVKDTIENSELNETEGPKNFELLQMSQAVNLIGSWEWDLQTGTIFWTDGMFQLRAAPVTTDHTISFEDTLQFIHEEDREMVIEKFNSLIRNEDVSFEYRIVPKEGPVKLIKAWAAMFRDENGKPLFLRGTSQDITELKETERKLFEANEVLRHAEEIAHLGSWQLNLKTEKLTYSDNMFRLFGYYPNAFVPTYEKFLELVHPDDRELVKKTRERSETDQEFSGIQFRGICKDGSIRHFRGSNKITLNDKNETVVFGTTRDVTDELSVLRQLEERTALSEMLFENSVDMIAAFDQNLNIIAWNKQCELRYGLKKEEVIGKNVIEVFDISNNSKLKELQRAAAGEYVNSKDQESTVIPGNFDIYNIPLKNPNGDIFGVLTVAHDVSEIRNANEQLTALNRSLLQKNRELEISNNELASFSYIASHDLQEPLRKIQTFSKRIVDKEAEVLSPQGKDYLKRMENASQRMQNLIDDLLTFSRTSTMPKEFLKVDLNFLLEDVKKEMKDVLEEKQAVITAAPLPVTSVIAFQFRQLLVNMISNSLKYAKSDIPPRIQIDCEIVEGHTQEYAELSDAANYYKLVVKDNGIGFEQQYSERIFELFQRLHGKYEYPGTGLGLAICRRIVHNHKGIIKAKGEPGVGAEFLVYLPVVAVKEF